MGAITASWVSVILNLWRAFSAGCICLTVVACASSDNFAPVTDVSGYEAVIQSGAARPYRPYVSEPVRPIRTTQTTQTIRAIPKPEIHKDEPVSQWLWPVRGPLLVPYSRKNKGIDIGGSFGEPIHATAAGRVVYAGDGLRGYGNLIIIKHNSQYLSAYAYNSRLFVHEGEWVKKGQKIGAMGYSTSGQALVHFEIRHGSFPVNPLKLL